MKPAAAPGGVPRQSAIRQPAGGSGRVLATLLTAIVAGFSVRTGPVPGTRPAPSRAGRPPRRLRRQAISRHPQATFGAERNFRLSQRFHRERTDSVEVEPSRMGLGEDFTTAPRFFQSLHSMGRAADTPRRPGSTIRRSEASLPRSR